MDENIIIGTIMVVAGVGLIIFREKFAQEAVSFQNKAFGFRFGQRTIDIGKLAIIPFSMIIIFWGILTLAGIWQFE